MWAPTQSRRRADFVGNPNHLNRIPSLLFMPVTTHHTRQRSLGRLVSGGDLMEGQCINKSCSGRMAFHKSAVVYSENASEATFHSAATHPCPKCPPQHLHRRQEAPVRILTTTTRTIQRCLLIQSPCLHPNSRPTNHSTSHSTHPHPRAQTRNAASTPQS